jgi:hypothetical protein
MATSVPTFLSIAQADGAVVATARPPDIYDEDITSYYLYRALDTEGTGLVQVDQKAPSPLSRWVNLFDENPLFGQRAYYYVTDNFGDESATLYFQAIENPVPATPVSLSAAAFGPYPLLGSDIYIDPSTGEGVIGPNGDFLSVTGLYCLAQDLRTRLITTQGELLLHPDFGLGRQRLIGSGQGDPVAEAQLLQVRIIQLLEADPRVDHVTDVQIVRVAPDAWTVAVTLVAVGAEPSGNTVLTFPYYTQ